MAIPIWLILVTSVSLIWYWKKRRAYKEKLKGLKEIPGPTGLPLVGSAMKLGNYPNEQYTKWAEEYGDIYQVNVAGQRLVKVNEPKLAKEILSVEPSFTGRFSVVINETYEEYPKLGIINSEGERWEVHRRFLLRQLRDFGFGKSSMENLIMNELNEVTAMFKKTVGEPVNDIEEKLKLSLVNSLWTILTSQRFQIDDPELVRLANNVSKKFNEVMKNINIGVLLLLPGLLKIFPNKTGYAALRSVFDECRTKFEQSLADHKKNFKENELNDFIDVYLAEMKKSENDSESQFYGKMAERQLVLILFDLFFAGTDTTAKTLSWIILYLCKYSRVQKRLQKEVNAITNDSRSVYLSDRLNMPYTLAMIDEIFRFSSIVPDGLPHRVMADKEFRGYFIPKDSLIQPNIYFIHHDPKIWGDPENFRPERFLSENGGKYLKSENIHSFQPGRRQCVGETLARDTIFLYLTNLFQQFNMEFDPGMEKEPGLEREIGFVQGPMSYSVIMKDRVQN